MIAYHVEVSAPDTHCATVTVTVPNVKTGAVFSIPAWTPGSYLLREFARYLDEPTAAIDGRDVACAKTAKGTWEVAGSGTLTIRYSFYGHELTVRTPHIDQSHAYFLGTNALVYVHGMEADEHQVSLTMPDGWDVFCALPNRDGAWIAEDYDVLGDTPFECGPDHVVHEFEALGVPHRFIFWGADAVTLDLPKLEADTRALIETNAKTFDGSLPYKNYDFVFHIAAGLRGGLEHLNSTVLATPWKYFDTEKGYKEMLELISHEHFHVWNVKRIRPAALGPFDYQNENYTTGLWVVEGFTSYFDALNCVRAGVVDGAHYIGRLGEDLTKFAKLPGRKKQTVAQASWDAWIRLYRPDENSPNRTVSYYLKGALVSLALDLEIRNQTEGKHELRDVMALLWRDFLDTGAGYADDSIPQAIRRATGVNAAELVANLVHTTQDPDFDSLLESHGLELNREGPEDPWLGIALSATQDGARVSHVRADGPQFGGGVYPGDILVAIDGRRVTVESMPAIASRLKPNKAVTAHLFRRDQLTVVDVTPAVAPKSAITLRPIEDATAEQRKRWSAWTQTKWVEPTRD
ncbi:MAG: putative metalloprotease with PDZ domain [Bradymonadia bacterium]|jgi:predicted metalloprotease with PDZ domain